MNKSESIYCIRQAADLILEGKDLNGALLNLNEAELHIEIMQKSLKDLLEAAKETIYHSVDSSTYPDGPCLDKSVRDELKAAVMRAEKRTQ